jgi:DNA-binding LytR/AlgR family response regulator
MARSIDRARGRLGTPPPDLGRLMRHLQAQAAAPAWLQASVGNTIHFIDLADVIYFRSEDKHTVVVTDAAEAYIRTPLKDLAERLEDDGFWQIHRGFMVAVRHVAAATRDADGALWVTLRGPGARLPVSQRFQHRFKGM